MYIIANYAYNSNFIINLTNAFFMPFAFHELVTAVTFLLCCIPNDCALIWQSERLLDNT